MVAEDAADDEFTDDELPRGGRSMAVTASEFRRFSALARRKPRRGIWLLPVLDPLGRAALVWGQITTAVDLTYTAFLVPLSMAFGKLDVLDAYSLMDFCGSAVYVADLLVEFQIGFLVRWDLQTLTITDGPQAAIYYVCRSTFWIDALAVAPLAAQVSMLATGNSTQGAVKLVQLFKLLRLMRVVRLIARMGVGGAREGSGPIQFLANHLSPLTMFALNILLSMTILLNLLACLWWWISLVESGPTWVDAIGKPSIDLYDSSDSTRWLVSAYFVATTISTIGFGDITAQTPSEMALVMLFMLTGVTYFGYLISTIGAVLSSVEGGKAAQAALARVHGMEAWLRQQSFPPALRRRIRRHFRNEWAVAATRGDASLLGGLPLGLRAETARHMQDAALADALLGGSAADEDEVQSKGGGGKGGGGGGGGGGAPGTPDAADSPVAPRVTPAMRARLARDLSELGAPRLLASGHRLCSQGEPATAVFLLDEGQMCVPVKGGHAAAVDAPAVLGVAALFAGAVPQCAHRLHTVRAATNCRVWAVDAAALARRLAAAPDLHLAVLEQYRRMAAQVAARLAAEPGEGAVAADRARLAATYGAILRGLAAQGAELGALLPPAAAGGAWPGMGRRGSGSARIDEEPDLEAAAAVGEEEKGEDDQDRDREHDARKALRRRQVSMSAVPHAATPQAGIAEPSEGVAYVG